MPEYIVYRHGGGEAVEGETPADTDKRPVARLIADDPADACRRAANDVTLDKGQWLSAESAAEVDAKVHEIGLRQEALDDVENP